METQRNSSLFFFGKFQLPKFGHYACCFCIDPFDIKLPFQRIDFGRKSNDFTRLECNHMCTFVQLESIVMACAAPTSYHHFGAQNLWKNCISLLCFVVSCWCCTLAACWWMENCRSSTWNWVSLKSFVCRRTSEWEKMVLAIVSILIHSQQDRFWRGRIRSASISLKKEAEGGLFYFS